MILHVAFLLSFDAESRVYFVVFIFLTTYLTLIELFLICGFLSFTFYLEEVLEVISSSCVASVTTHTLTAASFNSLAQNFFLKLISSFGCAKGSKIHYILNDT